MTNNMVLGLDIGVTSVGWGIISSTQMKVIDAGVRLFDERKVDDNAKRRTARGSRRLKNRRHTRRRDLEVLFKSIGFDTDNFKPFNNVLELRVKGLTEKLTMNELFAVCLNISKHRGSSYEMVDTTEDDAESSDALTANRYKLKKENKYVCEVQLEKLLENGSYRGVENHFRTEDYLKELSQILANTDLSIENQNQILNIVGRKRHYSEGPGSLKSPSEYGRFVYKDGEIIQINLIDKMLGKCSVYPEEVRAPHKSYSAELFNFLNDINNLQIDNRKLTQEEKEEILNVINEKHSMTPLQLSKLLEVDIDSIRGFRIDKKDKPLLTKLEGTKLITDVFSSNNAKNQLSAELMDSISEILLREKTIEERISKLKNLIPDGSETLLLSLANLAGFTKTHSLSLKALKKLNKELLVSDKNQMQLLSDPLIFPKSDSRKKRSKKVNLNPDDVILSGVALRAMNETFKVINALRKEYGEFDRIIVETTRAKNSHDEKNIINERQKYFENENKIVDELLKERGYTTNVNLHTKNKIKLYLQQDGKCIYTNTPIDLRTLIEDPTAYEIDHVIPLSISLDDSLANKVLCTNIANANKGNLTPYDAILNGKFPGQTWEKFKIIVSSLYSKRNLWSKRNYLLYDKDITKYSNLGNFINRNLADTSYSARVVLNTLQSYFKNNEIDTIVHTIRGGATSAFRKRVKIKKDRDEYKHHAIDALIIASLSHQRNVFNMMNAYQVVDGEVTIRKTGEVVRAIKSEEFLDDKYVAFIKDLLLMNEYSEKDRKGIKFSHKVDRKPNRRISDETIYSTREINGQTRVVKKYKDIYDSKFTALANDIVNNKFEDKYLMAKNDPQTFDKIVEIVNFYFNTYKDTKEIKVKSNGDFDFAFNPLSRHREETGEVIRKYSRKGNGPVVNQMRYAEDNLGNHIDITHKYINPKNKNIVLLQISPFRTDFYVNPDGLYKFVTIRYSNVRYIKETGKYVIDNNWYKQQLSSKAIDESFKFIFSLNRGDIIELTRKDRTKGIITETFKFIATNNDRTNQVEVKPINKYYGKQMMPTIGKSVLNIRKYNTDSIGNHHLVSQEALKLEF